MKALRLHFPARFGVAALFAAVAALTAADGHAADGCKAKIGPDGVIRVSAKNVVGTPVWGGTLAQANIFFANAATCHVGTNLKNCELGNPGEVSRITPPEFCRIFVADGSGESCSAYLKGCTPGQRPGGGFVKKSGDTMSGDLEIGGDLTVEGDVHVDLDTKGIVKAVVDIVCSHEADDVAIVRSINTVNGGSFSIDDGTLGGRCELTLPFSPSGRIIQLSTFGAAFVGFSTNGNTLEIGRSELLLPGGLPVGSDGRVIVTIY
jgi:hypothetical protein